MSKFKLFSHHKYHEWTLVISTNLLQHLNKEKMLRKFKNIEIIFSGEFFHSDNLTIPGPKKHIEKNFKT